MMAAPNAVVKQRRVFENSGVGKRYSSDGNVTPAGRFIPKRLNRLNGIIASVLNFCGHVARVAIQIGRLSPVRNCLCDGIVAKIVIIPSSRLNNEVKATVLRFVMNLVLNGARAPPGRPIHHG